MQPEPLKAVLKRPHDPVVAVVHRDLEWQTPHPIPPVEPVQVPRSLQHPPHLGGQHELPSRFLPQKPADPVLALAEPVEGRRVEIPHPGVPRGLERGLRLVLAHPLKQLPQGRAPEAHLRDGDPPASQCAMRYLFHGPDSPCEFSLFTPLPCAPPKVNSGIYDGDAGDIKHSSPLRARAPNRLDTVLDFPYIITRCAHR